MQTTRVAKLFHPGVLDAGFSALASFLVGLYAARLLDPTTLGGYALILNAFFLAATVSTELVLVPAEVAVMASPAHARLAMLGRSLRWGGAVGLAPALAVSLAACLLPEPMAASDVSGLLATAMLASALVPLQMHVRRMFQLAELPWYATAISVAHATVTLVAIAALHTSNAPSAWIPFGAMSIATLLSLALGVLLALRFVATRTCPLDVGIGELAASGRWLLLHSSLRTGAAFAGSALIVKLAGGEAMGYAEAARVAAQPLMVVALGLSTTIRPHSMDAARRLDERRARRVSRPFLTVLLAISALYLALVGWQWPLNPLPALLPLAYQIPGLLALAVVANAANMVVFPYRFELVGAGLEKVMSRTEALAAAALIVVCSTAAYTTALARPLAMLCSGLLLAGGHRRSLLNHYRRGPRRP